MSGFRENITYSQALTPTFMDQRNLVNNSANIFHIYTFNQSTGSVRRGEYTAHISIWILRSFRLTGNCRAKAVRMKIRVKKESTD